MGVGDGREEGVALKGRWGSLLMKLSVSLWTSRPQRCAVLTSGVTFGETAWRAHGMPPLFSQPRVSLQASQN